MADPKPDKAFPVSWDQFHRDARALAWRLSDKGSWQALVCVTRGGLVPAAIVARELGVPTVVALPGLTGWLRDGDTVHLDGAAGTVQRVERAGA